MLGIHEVEKRMKGLNTALLVTVNGPVKLQLCTREDPLWETAKEKQINRGKVPTPMEDRRQVLGA